jgi:hypothetical protein
MYCTFLSKPNPFILVRIRFFSSLTLLLLSHRQAAAGAAAGRQASVLEAGSSPRPARLPSTYRFLVTFFSAINAICGISARDRMREQKLIPLQAEGIVEIREEYHSDEEKDEAKEGATPLSHHPREHCFRCYSLAINYSPLGFHASPG